MVDSRRYEFEGTEPSIHEDARVSREATLVGDVTIEAEASIWPGVVCRGDVAPVTVGRMTHVGDNATLHASQLGEQVMCGHGAILNDAVVEDDALVGFNATLNSSVHVGAGSIVASGTVVPEGYDIPPESFVRGVPASVSPLSETTIDPDEIFEEHSSGAYTNLAQRHGPLFE
ncbi:gamma carbonic anhydrase family protein [Natrialbaceae archaeon AArc-T1-2]|uniref:gamma carbonic anhydrase family protein n=1 Tax=Natrialbaceae archaeon AArc-T1-2 TaxID=3053904 RepID=UPI00255A7DE4|nr:gamma carbonic anhydrase family protein [Natrialbaceae archaeon AArc-T1-2]WIV68590.1 gamma carbonic anhydrase family protein [Natrialbaceae archaeon AArc-T1-2]